jgi:TetR/AcrR family transcriptional regulator, transcriptional repressor for nem operon
MTDTKERLLDTAQALMQTRGYSGFSFQDLAREIGIRTASIHYYFPTKPDLGKILVKRYSEAFFQALGKPDEGSPEERLARYVSLFRSSLEQDRMCLCGMAGAEIGNISEEIGTEVVSFFTQNEAWLIAVVERNGTSKAEAAIKARMMFSALEGAMLVARASRNIAAFDDVAKAVLCR